MFAVADLAEIILEGVRSGRWRILVGADAHVLDQAVRAAPETAYDLEFLEQLADPAAARTRRLAIGA